MNNKEDIEKYINQKFDPGSIKNEGWNDPSDKVWENVEQELFAKKRSRFGFIPFVLINFLLVSLLFTGYLYFQNADLKKEIVELKSSENLKVLPSTTKETKVPQSVNQSNSIKLLESTSSISTNDVNQNPILSFPPKKYSNYTKLKNQDFVLNNRGKVEKINSETNGRSKEQSLASNVETDVRKIQKTLPNLNSKLKPLVFRRNRIILYPINTKDEQTTKPKPYFAVLPIVSQGILNTNGVQTSALTELIDKEYGNFGVGLDIIFSQPISNSFDFSVGLGIESTSYTTEYDITLPYDVSQEIIEGNLGYIDFAHSLPTAFGNTETELRLSRTRNSLQLEESNVNLDFNTNHKFFSVSIPIGLNYRLGNEKSFFNFGLVARPQYISFASSSIRFVQSNHSEIDAVNNTSFSSYSDINRFNVSIGLQAGYNFSITNKSGLFFNITAQGQLINMYSANNYSTTAQRLGVTVGYTYSL
ncbi:MAG: outer membrane beta-barrel protein [Saprospiraceae bacterium]|nr:outer membrane beta-barrel protein [Saprospiraceae bacterium]